MTKKELTEQSSNPYEDPYRPENVALFETLYGKNLISLGGHDAIDNMFSDIAIKGLKALDLGFGLGGVAFYLAEKYHMTAAGIEIYSWMVEYAQDHTPQNMTGALTFHTYTDKGELPFKAQTFDLVYSKGVLNHVADKRDLFRQVKTILKPTGFFIIADWIFPVATTDNTTPLVCETKASYEKTLQDAGFHEITFRDDSKLFIAYAKALLKNLAEHEHFIKEKYDEELFSTIKKQHEDLIDKLNTHQKIATRIIAKSKPVA